MGRLIFIFVIVALIYWLLAMWIYRLVKPYLAKLEKPNAATSSEKMVRCAHCGVHLPMSESILAGGEYYCSDAHRHEHADRSK